MNIINTIISGAGGGTINNQNKTVTPTTSSQSITADAGYTGLGTVTVNAVTSAIDANITAGNIKKDVTILGVTGTYEGGGTSVYYLSSSKTFPAGGLSLTFVIPNPGTYDNYLIKAYVYSIWKDGVEDTTRTYHTSSTTQLCDSLICIIPKYTTTAFKYGTSDTQANGANVYGFSERIVASSGVRSRDKITTAPTIDSSNITITLPSNNNIRAPGFGQTYNYEIWAWNN